MTTATKKAAKPDPVVEVTTKVTVPREDWIDFLTAYSDIFASGYIGYWARDVTRTKRGWLLWDFESDERPLPKGYDFVDRMDRTAEDKHHAAAVRAFKDGLELPKHYYVLDEDAAIRAYKIGCEKWGTNWFEEKGDGDTYDIVLQIAILGSHTYG
jgi:hypothetical protein